MSSKYWTASALLLALVLVFASAQPASRSLADGETPEVTPEATAAVDSQLGTPPLGDLADFGLQITSTEVVDKVVEDNFGNTTTLSATDGFKLVVVTLEGSAPYDCTVIWRNDEFAAVWTEPRTPSGGMGYEIGYSSAVGDSLFGWTIPDRGHTVTTSLLVHSDDSFTLQLAFILPDTVTAFRVRHLTSVEGQAVIQ